MYSFRDDTFGVTIRYYFKRDAIKTAHPAVSAIALGRRLE